MRTIIYLIFAWLLALTIASAGQYVQINRNRDAGRADARAVWHAVICSVEQATIKNPKIDAKQKQQAVQFWTTLLIDKIYTTPCK